MNSSTACPLDCYDACEIEVKNDKLKGIKRAHTQGFLCPNLNHYEDYETIKYPSYKGEEISMQDALLKLEKMLSFTPKDEILHYKGHGNFALMQDVTSHFFASYGATLTDGSLCDGAGEAGIIEGRGSNKNMPISEIAKSDIVIFWGRNPHATSSHLLPLIKDKKIIVIDPVKTDIAKIADLHIQIKAHGDLFLAMLLSRFLYIENSYDEEFVKKYASEYEEYYELTQGVRIRLILEQIDLTLGDIGNILELVHGKKVAIVCGVGIQKYSDGADVMRSIDGFAAMLGLFGKEGCGVAYLGASRDLVNNPFETQAKKVSKVNTRFEDFKTVFIQGANPLSQMPDSLRVKESISKVENVVYFGLYENESSEAADLIIPAKSFLHKDDIRTSYSHNAMMNMHKQSDCEFGISEYDLSKYLCDTFDIELKEELYYINHFKEFSKEDTTGISYVKGRENIPYQDGFDTQTQEFCFLEDIDSKMPDDSKLSLITSKSSRSLNSQFKRDTKVYINSSLGFTDGEFIRISSQNGSVELEVQNNDDVRSDSILIYSGTKGLNNLTSSRHSIEGKSAIYQEDRVTISHV
ncbi:MAG: molybdopterin oxidoreductase [Sulfurimonas sp.]|nr:MAG: molybdopterin oxidoreductase [Sulfurimonas sp.]